MYFKKKKNHKIVEKKNEMIKDFLFGRETLNIIFILYCIIFFFSFIFIMVISTVMVSK